MASILNSIFAIALTVEFIVGIVGNGFIALVNCVDCVKRRKSSLVDQILTSLAISRISLLFSVQILTLVYAVHPALLKTENVFRSIIAVTGIVTNHFSVWLAMCLSVFYFLKIAHFSNSVFLYLKWRVKKVILGTLAMSLVLLFFNITVIEIQIHVWNDTFKRNVSYNFSFKNFRRFPRLLFTNSMFMLVPFIVSLTVFLLLIFSLWKHSKRMRHSAKGSRDISTTAHVKALQTVVNFLLLHTIFLFCLILQISSLDFLKEDCIFFFQYAVQIAFPSGHSLFLILGNSNLRQAALSVLCWQRCWPRGAGSSGA